MASGDTIFAEATPPGRAGVSIVRVSGPEADRALTVFGVSDVAARRASLRALRLDREIVDRALVLRFPSEASFTGEAIVEFHLHGSPAVVRQVLRTLGDLSAFRQAEPGEFTRRALENGRLDLAEVEGLSDLLQAETEAQRRQAMRVFDGHFGRKIETWRGSLLRVVAEVEARIDFSDEEIPGGFEGGLRDLIVSVGEELRAEAAGHAAAERIRAGFEVALVGAPNVGKSTLLNALAGREAALTSEIAGTTRDVIEVRYDLRGLPVVFLDLAGIRDAEDSVEGLGIERARRRAAQADLRIFLGPRPLDVAYHEGDVDVMPKADLGSCEGELAVSGLTGVGVDTLLERVHGVLSDRVGSTSLAIRERHRVALCRASDMLGSAARDLQEPDPPLEVVAESLRSAMRALDAIVGRIGVEDVLGEIFSAFCIGK